MHAVAADITQGVDADLLVLIGAADLSCGSDRSLATAARREFHRRHYGYVLAVLKEFAANVGTVVIDPEEFAAATFRKFFRSASSFEDRSGGDSKKSAAQVRAYLGQAAANLAKDELDRISREHNGVALVVLDETRDVIDCSGYVDAKPTNPRALAALRRLLNEMKPEDRDILMTYANFGIPTSGGRELPRDVREALERRTGYERGNIRQKWRRLSERLKTQLESFVT